MHGEAREERRRHRDARRSLRPWRETALVERRKTVNATAEAATELNGRMEIIEGRLNIVDGRLARIEKHTGLVKA